MLEQWLSEMDYPRDRYTSPSAMVRMEGFLSDRLRDFGYTVQRQTFEIQAGQTRNLPSGVSESEVLGLQGCNLVAGSGPVLIGAHYDTVHLSPGADDNGSAVVAALAVAQRLADPSAATFVFFDMEEWNLIGARAYQGRPELAVIYESLGYYNDQPKSQKLPPGFPLAFPKIYAQLVLDGLRGDFQAVLCRPDSLKAATRLAGALPKSHLLEITLPLEAVGDFGRSDHLAFWERRLPAVMITDTANFRNPHYHLPTDRPSTLSVARIEEVVEATLELFRDQNE